LKGGETRAIVVRVDGRTPPHKGERVYVSVVADRTHVFDAVTGARIGGASSR
jgi:multiple sugar transport system ATP-binding protein